MSSPYGRIPEIVLVLFVLAAVLLAAFGPEGEPLPTCESSASCAYFGQRP